jgi:hypothetical protein
MHGGKSIGRPIIHGRYTKKKKQERREIAALLKALRALL